MVTNQGARKGGQAMGKNRVGPSQRVFRFNCIHKAFPYSFCLICELFFPPKTEIPDEFMGF